jgi:hypothetical protein
VGPSKNLEGPFFMFFPKLVILTNNIVGRVQ